VDFKIGAKELALREEIARFARAELPPGWVGPTLIDQLSVRDAQFESSMSKKLAKKGWLVMGWPKEYGGQSASVSQLTEYDIGIAYWRIPGSGMGIGGVHWVGPSLMAFGTDEQKKKYLPPIAAGEPDGYWCTGYSEPNAGSDFANLQTRAVRQGDYYVVNGQKVWTSEAHRARWCWLAVRTDPNAPKKHRGISLIIVDLKSPGVNVRPLLNYYGRHHFNEVFFDNVKVPAENLVGQENQGWYQLMHALAFERRMAAPITYGGFKRLFEELLDYAKEARQEGKSLVQNPIIRQKLAEIAIDLEVLRLFAYLTCPQQRYHCLLSGTD
jgi:alkylation response protein AidB-like acyl-CoA dehydrogenase